MKSRYVKIVLLLSILVSAAACTFDYTEARIAEDLEETVPETVLHDFTQVRIYNGVPEYRVYGAKAETYSKRNETVIEDVLFQEYNSEGELVTEGSADRVVFNSETEDARLSGNLEFYNSTEDAGVKADNLSWKDQAKTLTGRDEEYITVVKKDGSSITGKGFSADVSSKNITFSSDISGVWVDEDEEEGEEPEQDENETD